MQKLKFAIGIPTINRSDLLNEALIKYAKTYPNTDIFIIDNGNQKIASPHPKTEIFVSPINYGVAKSWNYLADRIFNVGYDYALILNDDIVLGSNENELNKFIEEVVCKYDFVVTNNNWCSFILSKETVKKVGWFDEKFGNAYFEDNDYYYRMQLIGMSYYKDTILDPEIFRNSQTIQKDNSLNFGFDKNKAYYISKWGGEPHNEKYKIPFNRID
jgi:GT2 family glycosyltransferase